MTNKNKPLAQIFFYQNCHKIFLIFFCAAFLLQIIFWFKTENIKPHYEIVEKAPNHKLLKFAALGDDEFLFRSLIFRLQNSGDIYLKFSALKDYDYSRLYQWFQALDILNRKSNSTPYLAAYYFSQTQNTADSSYIVKYLSEHARQDLNANWWWMFQAINVSLETLNDTDLALKLSYELSENNSPSAPLWTKQMPAFIYAKQGNGCMAFKIIKDLIDENNSHKREISASEMDFMRYFITTRLKHLKNQNFDPRTCKN